MSTGKEGQASKWIKVFLGRRPGQGRPTTPTNSNEVQETVSEYARDRRPGRPKPTTPAGQNEPWQRPTEDTTPANREDGKKQATGGGVNDVTEGGE